MTTRRVFVALLAWSLAPAAAWPAVESTLCVAPNGSDSNPGTPEKPFATLEKARQAVRARNQNMQGDIIVMLGGGTYTIDRSLVFGPDDSGTNGHNVIYRAQNDQTPIISGGRRVTGWQPDEKGRWRAAAPVENFRQLYVNGVRAIRARGGPPAGLKRLGNTGYTTTAVEMANWKNPADLEFCYVVVWDHTRCRVAGIRRQGDQAVVSMLQPYFQHARTKEGVQADMPDYIENALESPGRARRMVFGLPGKDGLLPAQAGRGF